MSSSSAPVRMREYLGRYRGRRILHVQSPGNAGDCLINVATWRMLRAESLDFRLAPLDLPPEAMKGCVILYCGGGNFTRYYNTAASFFQRAHRHADELVCLPHSFSGHEDVFRELGANVTLIARDARSLRHIQDHAPGANTLVADDMAFSLDVDDLLHGSIWQGGIGRLVTVRRAIGRYWEWYRYRSPSTSEIRCFRGDKERDLSRVPPPDNRDLSKIFEAGVAPEFLARMIARNFMRALLPHQHVISDRLHICIGAALLGKQVTMHDNVYGKLSAVYEQSMRDRFPNVHLSRESLAADA